MRIEEDCIENEYGKNEKEYNSKHHHKAIKEELEIQREINSCRGTK